MFDSDNEDSGLTIDNNRLLGFAFATADLLIEIGEDGRVAFALGAARSVSGLQEQKLVGRPWRDVVAPSDHETMAALFVGLADAGRRGPVAVNLIIDESERASHRLVSLSACRLTRKSRIACSVSLTPPPFSLRPDQADDKGFMSRKGFESYAERVLATARATGINIDLALVELADLAVQLTGMSGKDSDTVLRQVSGALKSESYAGSYPTRIDETHFAFLRAHGEAELALGQRLARVLSATVNLETAALKPKSRLLRLDPNLSSLERCMKALRYAVENFADEPAQPSNLSADGLAQSLRDTMNRAGDFGTMVTNREFRMVYQPVVSLQSGAIHHYEALVRFEGNRSPFSMIRMAEELDLIEQLDLAVIEATLKRLSLDPKKGLRLAVNVSGLSISQSSFVEKVRTLVKSSGMAPDRQIFEITESALIEDLDQANTHIQSLRQDGHVVCLDDFGAGGSSFAYLQRLEVDIVKIDGRYVRDLEGSGRDGALVRHLVGLCKELGVKTIAEMVENPAIEDLVRRTGVDYGQGWLYGEPMDAPLFEAQPPIINGPAKRARRVGATEGWS